MSTKDRLVLTYAWLRMAWGRYAIPIKLYRKWRRNVEKRQAERKALIRFWTDVLCQAGENAVHAGQFSRHEINTWYITFGKNVDLTDLLPKKLEMTRRDFKSLRSAIMKRIGPEARQEYKEKKDGKTKSASAKAIRYQFKRAFRNQAA